MGVPQFIMMGLMFVDLMINAVSDGTPKDGEYDFKIALIATIIQICLLAWGGFFKVV